MNILYISSCFPLVSETFIIYEIADLIARGVDIRIVSLRKPDPLYYSDLPERLGFADRIYFRQETPEGEAPAGVGRLLWDVLRKGNIPAFFALLRGQRGSGNFARGKLMRMAKALHFDDWTPDVIHCHFGPLGVLAAALKMFRLTNAKVTTTFHGYDVSVYLREHPGVYTDLFRNGDHFFAISQYYLDVILSLGALERKSSVFHMSVDCDALSFAAPVADGQATLRFISVGRMVEKKGFEYAIRAFARAFRDQQNAHLDIIGNGPLLPAMNELVQSLGMERHITLHGSLQHDVVQTMLRQSHVFVLPSVTAANGDMEGIPVALMEAMALGLPVLSTRHSGIPELVEDAVSGLLVDERDDGALARAMTDIVADPARLPRLATAARLKVEQEFNRRLQSDKLYNELKALCGARS